MKIYSYFAEVPQLNVENELRLSILWRNRWREAGHEPIILNEWHARRHPLFQDYDKAVSALPSINPAPYERACYLRWLALAQVGGGYMTDLDVMPRRIGIDGAPAPLPVPDVPSPCVIVYQTPCCPCFVWAESAGLDLLLGSIASHGIGSRPQDGKGHFSDQYALEDLHGTRVPWLHVRDVVKIWQDKGWQSAPFIHFPNVATNKLGPKHAVISSLDPFTFAPK